MQRSFSLSSALVILGKLVCTLPFLAVLACENVTAPRSSNASGPERSPSAPALSSSEDLVGWWPGEDDTDLTGNHDGSMGGGLTGGNPGGKRDGAFLFDGVDDEFVFGNSPFLDFTQVSSFTFEAWVKTYGDGAHPVQTLISTNYACTPTNQSLFIYAGKLHFIVRDEHDAGTMLVDPNPLSTGVLHHVAGVREASAWGNTLKLYVDGVLVEAAPDVSSGALSLETGDFIGRNFPCATTNQFNGIIDEVKIYIRALSDDEILCAYRCDESGPAVSSLVATPARVGPAGSIQLTAVLDELSGSLVTGAEYRIDGGAFIPMAAADGHFGKPTVSVVATVSASSLDAVHEICIRGSDSCGNSGDPDACITVVLDDEGPVVSLVTASPNPVQVNATIQLSAEVDDIGSDGSNILTSDYSVDGGAFVAVEAADGSFDEIHEDVLATIPAFPSAGVHDVCMRGVDEVGNEGSGECILLAVFDPSEGFVTGAGTIDSPAGAYLANLSATGLARFGFVSRYFRGAAAPSGNTQFIFRAVDLEFRSTSYEWLVIAGSRAQFKGRGTINGTGDYGFLLTAIDGQINGGGGVDKFRIKIWDRNSGQIMYDNQPGASDIGTNATEIQGGQISIHTG